jgi:hypothetical protein
VIRRSPLGGLTPTQRRQRFAECWAAWSCHRRQVHALQREAATPPAPLTWQATVRDLARRARTRATRLTS